MLNDYGKNTLLSYNKYLRVPELIDLQTCLSTPAHHDELLFITVHQAYELWFKQILHEIDAAIELMNKDRTAEAAMAMRRVVEIEKLLITQIHILETMTPIAFLGFRDELNPASGFQSMQFREIEFSSGLKDARIQREFAGDEFAQKSANNRTDKQPDNSEKQTNNGADHGAEGSPPRGAKAFRAIVATEKIQTVRQQRQHDQTRDNDPANALLTT